jgi:hypothetical protein
MDGDIDIEQWVIVRVYINHKVLLGLIFLIEENATNIQNDKIYIALSVNSIRLGIPFETVCVLRHNIVKKEVHIW